MARKRKTPVPRLVPRDPRVKRGGVGSSAGSEQSGVLWVLVNCNSVAEATTIGDAALAARLATCFDVFPRTLTRYFWPPKSGKVEEATGALLMIETFEEHVRALRGIVRAHHSDQLPFFGSVRIEHVDDAYRSWMAGELARNVTAR